MVMRVAEFAQKPAFHDDEAVATAFRAWMKSQPGSLHGWHATESATGKTVSVSVWKDRASLLATKERPFQGGPLGAQPDRVVVFDQVEEI